MLAVGATEVDIDIGSLRQRALLGTAPRTLPLHRPDRFSDTECLACFVRTTWSGYASCNLQCEVHSDAFRNFTLRLIEEIQYLSSRHGLCALSNAHLMLHVDLGAPMNPFINVVFARALGNFCIYPSGVKSHLTYTFLRRSRKS